jgi:RNA polymerase sigma-70 factor (ECF subfamily)
VDADTERALELPAASAAFDFEAVFQEQYGRIARIIARLVQDPARAEEVAVDVFLKLYRSPRAHGPQAPAWLYRTAVRAGLDELRTRGRRRKYEGLAAPRGTSPSPEQVYSATERQDRVRTVLARLNRRQAEMLFLRSAGLSYGEVAETLQLNPASIGTLLRRAEQAFRKEYLKRYGSEE